MGTFTRRPSLRVVLDTNIFISALITRSSPSGRIYADWRRRKFELVTSALQIAELKRVSHYAKIASRIPPNLFGEVLNIMGQAQFVGKIPRKHTCDDPDDAYLLNLADVSQADFLITGDRRSSS